MSVLEFSHKLGVSDRIVTRWEAGGAENIPRMVNQAALDTLLAQADPDVHGRFVGLLAANDGPALHQLVEPEENQIVSGRYTKHPRDGRMMARVPEGIFLSGTDCEPTWVEEFYSTRSPSPTRTTRGSARPRAMLRHATGKADDAPDRCMTTQWWRCRGAMRASSPTGPPNRCPVPSNGKRGPRNHRHSLSVGRSEDSCQVQRSRDRRWHHDLRLPLPQRGVAVRGLRALRSWAW
jgi:hypothetical protein